MEPENQEQKKRGFRIGGQSGKEFRQSLELQAIGWHLVIAICLGLFFGYNIDKAFGTKPLFLIVFLIFGIIAGFLNIFRELQKLDAAERAELAARKAEESAESVDSDDKAGS